MNPRRRRHNKRARAGRLRALSRLERLREPRGSRARLLSHVRAPERDRATVWAGPADTYEDAGGKRIRLR
jgi:hypothetical protein